MQIIPVIDLKNRLVVHAYKGRRREYAPVASNLCKDSSVDKVIEAYLSLHGFNIFYIADLDAISSAVSINRRLIADVLACNPNKLFWIDSGAPFDQAYYRLFPNYLPVIGTESLTDDDVDRIERFPESFVLSLDYSASGRLGSRWIFDRTDLWPETIIVMTLALIGSSLGPDFDKLRHYRERFPEKRIIAAGGIRDKRDLLDLKKIGIDDVLIASALHSGALSAEDLAEIS